MKVENVIIKPVLTEKATNLANQKVYMFYVKKQATKHVVKNTLEKLYQVKVGKITSFTRKGKKKRSGKKMVTRTLPDKKIVYVQVLEGKIDLFPQV